MKVRFGSLLFLIALACVSAAPAFCAGAAEDEANFKYQTVTTKEGLTFRVPEDMPIESRGGIQAPIPFDEYMYGKFKQMDGRLARIEAQLQKIEELLEEEGGRRSGSRLLSASTS
jgi:hypothetical protein